MSSLWPALRPPSSPPYTLQQHSSRAAALRPLSPCPSPQISTVKHSIPSQSLRKSPHGFPRLGTKRGLVLLAANAESGNFEAARKLYEEGIENARKLFDGLPPSVKGFPWGKALGNLQAIIFELVLAVARYLCLPLLAVTSLSEMSYSAHERKMGVIPIPFLIGFALAGVLKDAAVELSSDLKEGGFPWYLTAIAVFFALLKLPGPYYPYWGRLVIPHFANGALWRTAWLAVMWYRRPHSAPEAAPSDTSVA